MRDVVKYGYKSCLSHCLKTPLQRVIGFLTMYEMGAYGTPNSSGLEAARKIEDSVWKQDAFITYLLEQLSIADEKDGKFLLELDGHKIQQFYNDSISKS